MSRSFYWESIEPPPPNTRIGLSTAYVLADRYGRDSPDDPLRSDEITGLTFDPDDTDWLRGVLAATNSDEIRDDVQGILAGIEEHGAVRLGVEP